MKRRLVLALSLPAFVACSSQKPYSQSIGQLQPGATMTVTVADANVNVYKPAEGEPANQFTVAAMARPNTQPAPPKLRPLGKGLVVDAKDPLYGMLVRLPDHVNLVVNSEHGNVNVTDVSGTIDVNAKVGNVHIMVPGIAQASAGQGNVDVTIGATQWNGTLKFTAEAGDVTVYIPETAKFHARLHTDDGTIFTDFGLRGTSKGTNETIDAPANGGGSFGVDIESHRGTVRLLRLTPQA